MEQIFCPACRLRQPAEHDYCVRCGHALPSHLLHQAPVKRARFFAGVKVSEGDPANAFLRVSCYLKEQTFTTPEGSVVIPGHHVRFSIWSGERALCVLSIPETEARDLARFIDEELSNLDRATQAH
jgi:hypothetical protein